MQKHVCVLIVTLLSISFMMGCIRDDEDDSERYIHQMMTDISLNSSDINNINISSIKGELNAINYDIENRSNNNQLEYYLYKPQNKTYIHVAITIWKIIDSTESNMSILYQSSFPESELEENKQYIKNEIDTLSNILKITINWSEVEWSYTYGD